LAIKNAHRPRIKVGKGRPGGSSKKRKGGKITRRSGGKNTRKSKCAMGRCYQGKEKAGEFHGRGKNKL